MGGVTADRPTLADLVAVLERAGAAEEPDEEVAGLTILHHGLQCAALLAASDPDDLELQVAGLVHDVGHVLAPGRADAHAAVGAAAAAPVFGARVAALIGGHVAAKRYLVSVDDSYRGELSAGSLRTLAVQGDAMGAPEVAVFLSGHHADATVRLRRADEASKDPTAEVPSLDQWLAALTRLADRTRSGRAGSPR
jgi:predicted HD phosphohydrolase